jgi:hypothetical protein
MGETCGPAITPTGKMPKLSCPFLSHRVDTDSDESYENRRIDETRTANGRIVLARKEEIGLTLRNDLIAEYPCDLRASPGRRTMNPNITLAALCCAAGRLPMPRIAEGSSCCPE